MSMTKDEAKKEIGRLANIAAWARHDSEVTESETKCHRLSEEYDNAVEKMKAIIDQLCPRWIPVSERLPEDGTPVLAYCTLHKQRTLTYESVVETWFQHGVSVSEPTHWMPLPESPEKKEGGE